MTWTGLPAQILGPVALAGVAVLLLLFFLRPRPQVLAVPSHVLWRQVLPRRLDPLIKEIIALILQILALLALVGALGQPLRRHEEPPPVEEAGVTRPRDRVVVVDLSASMAAREGEGTRLDGVVAQLVDLVDDLAEGERLAIVRAGPVAEVAVPWTADVDRLGLAVRSLRQTPGRADLEGAMAAAAGLLATAARPAELRVFADAEVPAPRLPDGCVLVRAPVARPAPNLAVTAFDVRATEGLPAQMEAFVRVTSFADVDARVTISVETPTRILGRASYDLPAGGSLDRTYRFYPPDEDRVEVHLRDVTFAGDGGAGELADALAMDDQAFAFLPGLRPARVLLVSRGNQYLRMALSLVPGLRLDEVTPADYSPSRVAPGRYDVVFFDSFVPERAPRVGSFYINPPASVAGFALARRVEAPVTTDWNLGHPLFANLVLRDLHVSLSGQFEPGPRDTRLIGTATGPIALAREAAGVKQVVFGFDFADSDLPLRVAFPQLIFNAVLWMREGRAVSPAAGPALLARDPLWLHAADDGDGIAILPLLDGGDEARQRIHTTAAGDGLVRLFPPRIGFFELRGTERDGPVAVSMLDPLESELRRLPETDDLPAIPPPAERPPEDADGRWPPWVLLGLAAMALLIGEFALINR